ncbi:MAG: 6-carboxytetrahydropterin synthase [Magnetococcales bacterium]|nr:6-carboxytetrahydropterin synthase [Magnetococcales bacterium]
MKIARTFHFHAAHRLPEHDGCCRRLHGHSYRLELVFAGTPRSPASGEPQSGFIADFGRIQTIVQQQLIDPYLDHHDLTESLPGLPYTSAEYLSAWIIGWCMRHLDNHPELAGARIRRARLWETEHSWADASRKDAERLGFDHA